MRRFVLALLVALAASGAVMAQPAARKYICVTDIAPGDVGDWCNTADPCGGYMETGELGDRGRMLWCNDADDAWDFISPTWLQGCRLPDICGAGERRITLATDTLRIGRGSDTDSAADEDIILEFTNFSETNDFRWDEALDAFEFEEDLAVATLTSCLYTKTDANGVISCTSILTGSGAGEIPYSDGSNDLTSEGDFLYDAASNTQYVDNVDCDFIDCAGVAIDKDSDGTNEVAVDATNATLGLDLDDDGTQDETLIADTVYLSYHCEGDTVPGNWNTYGAHTYQNAADEGRFGVCVVSQSAATADTDGFAGFWRSSNLITNFFDPLKARRFRAVVALEDATNTRAAAGVLRSITTRDFTQINRGIYFLCCPSEDVDGVGGAGSANDQMWWFVVQNGDADTDACALDTATNTSYFNTEVSCDGGGEWAILEYILNAAGTSVTAYVNGVEETTISSNLPALPTDGPVIWTETDENVQHAILVDSLEAWIGW